MKLMRQFREEFVSKIEKKPISILDIGSMRVHRRHNTYKRIFSSENYNYIGMDLEPGLNVDIVGYENIKDVYDVVISGQVLEHVKRPWDIILQWRQYFKKYICVIAPHTCREHKHPFDTYRYFPDGMKDLFEYANIIPINITKGITDTMAIGIKND